MEPSPGRPRRRGMTPSLLRALARPAARLVRPGGMLVIGLALLLTACGSASSSGSGGSGSVGGSGVGNGIPTAEPPAAIALAAYSGHTFVSTKVTVDGKPHALVDTTTIMLTFKGTDLGIQAGCNSMFATVRPGDDGLVVQGPIGGTEMGATRTVNVSQAPGLAAEEFTAEKGYFDVAIECTGAGVVIKDVLPVLRPRGSLIQVGVTGEVAIPINAIVGKEIRIIGAFRFHQEYALAARLIKEGRINVKPIITATLPFERAVEAFEMASDRKAHMKVQLTF